MRRSLTRPCGRRGFTSNGEASSFSSSSSSPSLVAHPPRASSSRCRFAIAPPTCAIASVSRAHAPRRDRPPVGHDRAESDGAISRTTALRLASGVMSTVVVRTLLAPFERIKLEYQLNRSSLPFGRAVRKVFLAEGVRGFWRGNGINLLRVCPYKAINFAAFDAYRGVAVALSPNAPEVNRVLLAVAGACAGLTSVSTCFPMDVVRTRLLVAGGMAKYGGVRRCIARLHAKEGFGAFYRGFLPAIIAMTPNGAVYYTVYDRLKTRRIKRLEEEARARGDAQTSAHAGSGGGPIRVEQGYMMLFGAAAGATAEFSTYPLEVVRRRMQLQGGKGTVSQVVGKRALRRMTTTLSIILRRHGVAGLYMGCLPSVIQVLPSAALGYYSYEMFKRFLNVGDE